MATEKELTLMMRIKARADEAMRVFRQVDQRLLGMQKAFGGDMGRAIATPFKALGRMGGMLLAPLKVAAGTGLVLGTMLLALGGKAVATTADFEGLNLRLESVMASEKEAAAAFKEVKEFGAATPFKLGELVETRILLEAIGVKGIGAVKSVGNAAAGSGKQIAELASVVASMETEPLRRLGIQVKRAGESFDFNFRDKLSKVRRVVASTSDDARKALLGIFNVKFGGAVDKLAGSLAGRFSTLTDNVDAVLDRMGAKLKPVVMGSMNALITGLDKALAGDRIDNFGEKFAAGVGRAVDSLYAVIRTAPYAFDALRRNMQEGGNAFENLLNGTVKGLGETLVVALVEGIMATFKFWAGVGKLIAGAFVEEILKLPFMAGRARESATAALPNVDTKTLDNLGRAQMPKTWDTMTNGDPLNIRSAIGRMVKTGSQDFAAKVAAAGTAGEGTAALRDIRGAMAEALSNVSATVKKNAIDISSAFKDDTGLDIAALYKFFASEAAAKRSAGELEQITLQRRVRDRDPDSPYKFYPRMENETVVRPAGEAKMGDKINGATVINIQNLSLRADDKERLINQLMNLGLSPAAVGLE